MPTRSDRRTAGIVVVTALLTAAVVTGVRSATAVTTTLAGDAVAKVRTVRSDTGVTRTGGTAFVEVPTAETTIVVPRGTRALLLIRFSAESNCTGGTGWCTLRIMVDKVQATPAAGNSFAFDWASEGDEYEAHSMERVRGPLGPGTYAVRVQWAVSDSSLSFWLDDWLLTIERVRVE